MKNASRSSSSTRSWKQIRQNANRKVITSHARKRMMMVVTRGVLLLVALAALGAAGYFGLLHWREGMNSVNTALPAQPLRQIIFTTDGVLTKEWLDRVLELPEGADMMSIDIHEKKSRLELYGQVKTVIIRRLPDSLVVDVQERYPVLRLRMQGESGEVKTMLISRDGTVYDGFGYDAHELLDLPFVAGVKLQRQGKGFRRLQGMEQVDDFLQVARTHAPHLVRGWKVVDCRDLPLIRVRSDEIREIVFGAGRYKDQLRWLDMTLESNRRQMLGMRDYLDLSLGNQVVVR